MVSNAEIANVKWRKRRDGIPAAGKVVAVRSCSCGLGPLKVPVVVGRGLYLIVATSVPRWPQVEKVLTSVL